MSWNKVKLSEVAEIERDGIASDAIQSGTRYLGLENIESGGRILGAETVDAGDLASTKFRFTDKHVLYGKLRPYLAKIAMPDFDGICSTDIVPIMPGSDLDRSFLSHYLRQPSMIEFANSRTTGANLPRLSPKSLADFEIPLPPLDDQKRIAAILDEADELRRKRQRAIDRLNQLGQAIFNEMFGQRHTVAQDWRQKALGSLCELVRGSSPRPQGDPRYFGGNVPRLMIADITRDGMIVMPKIDSLTGEGAKKSREMSAGSVVMAVSGAVGLPAILAVDACIHDGFVGFRSLHKSVLPEYIYWYLLVNREEHKAHGTGAIWVNLTTDQVKRFAVPIPPMDIQMGFVAKMAHVAREITLNTSALRGLEALFHSLQNRAFRGGL